MNDSPFVPESLLRRLVAEAPAGFYLVDIDTFRTTYLNGYVAELIGRPPEELEGRSFLEQLDNVHPDDRPNVPADPQALADFVRRQRQPYLYRMRDREGNWRPIATCNTVFETKPDGAPKTILGIAVAPIENEAMLAALESQERLYQTLVETAPTGILELDSDGRILFANSAFERAFGHPAAQIMGEKVEHLLPTARERAALRAFRQRMVHQRPAPEAWHGRLQTTTGGIRDIRADWDYRYLSDGALAGFICVVTDTTREREVEDQLRAAKVFYQELLDGLTTHIAVLDEQGRVVIVNAAWRNLCAGGGEEPDRWEGKDHHTVCRHAAPENSTAMGECLKGIQRVTSGEQDHFELQYACPAAPETRWFSFRASLLAHQGKRWVIVAREEITERKRHEQAALQHERELLQADKMASLGVLVGGVAHEISNPNHLIRNHLSFLSEVWASIRPMLDRYHRDHGDFQLAGLDYAALRAEIPHDFTEMVRASRQIESVVYELKQYMREAPEEALEQVDMNGALTGALTLLHTMVSQDTGRLEVDRADSLPPFLACEQRVEQVIINLVQNACQAAAETGGTVRVRTWHEPETQTVCLLVHDDGPGIAPEHLASVTQPFFTTRREAGGTGLGLAIARRLTEKYSGTLALASEPGRGTGALLRFPACDGAGEAAP